MPRIPVTAIILTFNEELNIGRCVRALRAFDEVVVVDSGSTDGTVAAALAARPGARVLMNPFEDFGQQRNWALDHAKARNDWILFIDADEFMTPALAREIDAFARNPRGHVGGYIAGRNYFLGRWIKHSTYYPSYQLRLLRRGEVRYRKEGHGQREVTDGPLAYLREGWRHEGFSKGVADWIARHNRYSTAEIELILRDRDAPLAPGELFSRQATTRRRAVKRVGARIPGRPFLKLLYAYGVHGCWRDGWPGFYFNALRFAHEIHVVVKLAERRWEQRGATP